VKDLSRKEKRTLERSFQLRIGFLNMWVECGREERGGTRQANRRVREQVDLSHVIIRDRHESLCLSVHRLALDQLSTSLLQGYLLAFPLNEDIGNLIVLHTCIQLGKKPSLSSNVAFTRRLVYLNVLLFLKITQYKFKNPRSLLNPNQ